MGRKLGLLYAGVNYLSFLAVYLYLIGFLINAAVPKSIDTGEAKGVLWAVIIDAALLASFGVQHSVMARQWFKRWWTKLIPKSIERSTYVLISNLMMVLLFWQWQPIPQELWKTDSHLYQFWWYTAFATGSLFVPTSTLFINHFDLFGLRQVWLKYRGREYSGMKFATPGPYRVVRHPLYVGWLIMFWATPVMTVGHLLFAGILTGYILIAIRHEERDLEREFGALYRNYKATTPMLIPKFATPRIVRPDSAMASEL